MHPTLHALIDLQALDSALEQARKRLAEIPAAEQALDAQLVAATATVDAAKSALTENQTARRQIEKDVAAVDARMARFEDHKAAVKTNQEYQALNHEIATAKSDKDALEERVLISMEEADALSATVKTAETTLAGLQREVATSKAALAAERSEHDAAAARLSAERTAHAKGVDAPSLARYEQLLKGRRGIAVAQMIDGICSACHVRLRPNVTQAVRRNDDLTLCDSCQRILYYIPPPAAAAPADPPAPAST